MRVEVGGVFGAVKELCHNDLMGPKGGRGEKKYEDRHGFPLSCHSYTGAAFHV